MERAAKHSDYYHRVPEREASCPLQPAATDVHGKVLLERILLHSVLHYVEDW